MNATVTKCSCCRKAAVVEQIQWRGLMRGPSKAYCANHAPAPDQVSPDDALEAIVQALS